MYFNVYLTNLDNTIWVTIPLSIRKLEQRVVHFRGKS